MTSTAINYLSPELRDAHAPSVIATMRRADPKFDAIMAQLVSARALTTRQRQPACAPATEPAKDYGWLLTSELLSKRVSDLEIYFAELRDGKVTGRDATITWDPDGRMLFDGEDIETEDFMAYTGLADDVAEGQDVGNYWVQTGADDDSITEAMEADEARQDWLKD